ncbi:F-box protein At5g67140 isoform X2 [Elaeis guineensis]|uniref:F-box protein At5g67140 isoform X2 n=1 Tax=Elaeis guineensis var. tenera TaxID=51953 RepID=UPI003C6CE795
MEGKGGMVAEAEIERLPVDLLAHIFSLLSSFRDHARASGVCRKWRGGVEQSLASREWLSFSGWKMDDASTARLVCAAYNLKELNIARSCWGCQITDEGLYKISLAKCVRNLTSISLWGLAGITDKGVIQLTISLWSCRHVTESGLNMLVNKCRRLESINVWGMRVPVDCFISLLSISPALQIKPMSHHLSIGNQLPVS